MYRGVSTSVLQIYKIYERNANQLTFVNTMIIEHFSSVFRVIKTYNATPLRLEY